MAEIVDLIPGSDEIEGTVDALGLDLGEDTPVTEDPGQENAEDYGTESESPAEDLIIMEDPGEEETGQAGTSDSAVQALDDTESLPKELRAEIETSSADVTEAGFPVPGWMIGGLAGAAIGAGVAAGIFALVLSKRRRKQRKKSADGNGSGGADGALPQKSRTVLPDANGRQIEIFVGKVHETGARDSQQDSFAVSDVELMMEKGLLAVVADGMGGLSDGDRVSQAATEAMMEGFYTADGTPEQVLLQLLSQANGAVNRLLGPEGLGKSGSTMVASLIRDGKFYYLSVGDSRIALLRDGELYQLNREHVYRNELAVDAVNGRGTLQGTFTHPKGSGLSSFLGMGVLKYVDIPAGPVELRAGDQFVLMSDGVYNALSPWEIARDLRNPAQQAADALRVSIQAKHYSTQDNYTAIILEVRA